MLLVSLLTTNFNNELSVKDIMLDHGRTLCGWLAIAVAAKLLIELSFFIHLWDAKHSPLKRSALLLLHDLKKFVLIRFTLGIFGGLVLPLLLLTESMIVGDYFHPWFVGGVSVLMTLLLLAGELYERYLFFVSSVVAKMPGAPAA